MELRIIDANANRAREALRVMEDAARFVLDDGALCARLKEIRHGIAAALGSTGEAALAWRDTAGDVGTAVGTASEYSRVGTRGVVVAAGKRLGEALRSIEEFAKVAAVRRPGEPAGMDARAFEALRYRAYQAERDLVLAMGAGRATGWKLCVIITEALCAHRPWLDVARLALEGGADCLQLREKSLDSRELLARARALVGLVRGDRGEESARSGDGPGAGRASVIINDRPDIALLSGADGVHLGQTDLPVHEARKVVGLDRLVGVSTENVEQARRALHDGADYCGAGPMFPTSTKDKPRLAGPSYLREYLAHRPPLPHCLAIGGVAPERMGDLHAAAERRTGEGWGIAVSGAVCGADDPAGVCRALLATGAEPTGQNSTL